MWEKIIELLGLSIREVWAVEKLFDYFGKLFTTFSVKGFISTFVAIAELIGMLIFGLPVTPRGQTLDLTGIKITYTSDDGTIKTVTDTSLLTVKGYDSTKTGKQTVTVSYGQYSDTFDVEVKLTFWQWILRILFLGFIKF